MSTTTRGAVRGCSRAGSGSSARARPLTADAVSLVAVHEVGGWPDANLVQAADSLSFIETLGPLVRQWIADGTVSRESGLEKMAAMWERIQVPVACARGRGLYERALQEFGEA